MWLYVFMSNLKMKELVLLSAMTFSVISVYLPEKWYKKHHWNLNRTASNFLGWYVNHAESDKNKTLGNKFIKWVNFISSISLCRSGRKHLLEETHWGSNARHSLRQLLFWSWILKEVARKPCSLPFYLRQRTFH